MAEPKQVSSLEEARKYLKTLLPQYNADMGDGSRAHYEQEAARLQAEIDDPNTSEDDRRTANGNLIALNQSFGPALQQWLTEDIQNAKTDDEAQAAAQKLDALRSSSFVDYNPALVDLFTGGQGAKSGYVNAEGADNFITGPILGEQAAGWNRATYEDYGNQIGDLIKRNAEITSKGNLALYDNTTGRALREVDDANAQASATQQEALQRLVESGQLTRDQANKILDGLARSAETSNANAEQSAKDFSGATKQFADANQTGLRDYLGATDPLLKELQTQGYTGVSSDKADIQRTLDAYDVLMRNAKTGGSQLQEVYDKFKGLSDPTMTAKERAILEAGQRRYAIADKAGRDATARSLQAQGVYSGGAAVASQAARAQQLGDERVQALLGAQGSAVDRAMQALAGMQTTAAAKRSTDTTAQSAAFDAGSSIRSANDAVSQFNKAQEGLTQRHREAFAQQEAERRASLAGSRLGAQQTTARAGLDSAAALNQSIQDQIDRAFARTDKVAGRKQEQVASNYAMDKDANATAIDLADREAGRTRDAAAAAQAAAQNRAALNSSGNKEVEDSLKYLLGLRAEQLNLKNKGV